MAHIGEVDERRLYAREASPSMFAYCTGVLHLSAAEAYLRIAAARASREHPMLLAMLADGRLHLTGIALLASHLTRGNSEDLLARATHKSKREIEELIAELAPRPDAPAVIRKLPERRGKAQSTPAFQLRPDGVAPTNLQLPPDRVSSSGPEGRRDETPRLRPEGVEACERELLPDAVAAPPPSSPAPPARVEPLAPGRYKVQFTASAELRDKLERLRALVRSSVPDGDLAVIIEQAVTEKLQRLESRRFARTQTARKTASFAQRRAG